MKAALLALAALFAAAAPAAAQIEIRIDTSLADQALGLVCSGRPVDEAAVRASPLVQAQIRHNSRLIAGASMDAYVAALQGLSACRAPDPDPFRAAAILENPEVFRAKVAAIVARQDEMAARAAAMIAPYSAPDFHFSGAAVLAVPYFSCGGFADGAIFFVDIACLDADLSQDIDALTLMITHETYHAVQAQTYFPFDESVEAIDSVGKAHEYMFSALLVEGMAERVAPSAALPVEATGPLTQINRGFANSNRQRMRANFMMLGMLFEHIAHHPEEPRAAFERAYGLAFSGGTYEQFAYYVGARMAADIDEAWGRQALLCVVALPAEQFALAHDAVAEARGEARLRLPPHVIAAANTVAAARPAAAPGYAQCQPA